MLINPMRKMELERRVHYALLQIIQTMIENEDNTEEIILVKEQISVVLRLSNLPAIPWYYTIFTLI